MVVVALLDKMVQDRRTDLLKKVLSVTTQANEFAVHTLRLST